MKTKKTNKLALNKETIAILNNDGTNRIQDGLHFIRGGDPDPHSKTCKSNYPPKCKVEL